MGQSYKRERVKAPRALANPKGKGIREQNIEVKTERNEKVDQAQSA